MYIGLNVTAHYFYTIHYLPVVFLVRYNMLDNNI